ncbi:spore germination protein [Anoxybacteroides tepidamans]|uniref:spore germination protein n=1 Tax=Anoxybacteroides tepidamans TaxID=265948 RepID=UPI0004844A6D|nr:spore germination protein [Anoxybacillus tepidamans]
MRFFKKSRNGVTGNHQNGTTRNNEQELYIAQQNAQPYVLSFNLEENIETLQSVYENCVDVVFRSFQVAGTTNAVLVYIDGLVNVEELDLVVLPSLMRPLSSITDFDIHQLLSQTLTVSKVSKTQLMSECIESISSGKAVLLINRYNHAFSLGVGKWEKRSIDEPVGEAGIKGPREGFIESLGTNLALVRRKVKSPNLKTKAIKIGTYTQTEVVVCYIEGLAHPALIQEVEERLHRIKIDGILDVGYIEELIEDNPYSPFPQMLNTERPDVVAASLLEGRFAILQDGTPFALVAPISFYSLLQSHEDYYERSLISTVIRWVRYLFLLISLFLPSLYVALLTFHQEMVPTTLLLTMAASRELIPFPALVEALMMEVVFEALREAGVRLPKQAGAAVSIVGALVIGQAAVQAGIVSAPMIMVVSLTGIASFTVPRYATGIAIRMLRFPMILLAGSLGLLGVMLGLLLILIHMATLRSFGVPYLSPMAPMQGQDMKDVLVRAPLWKLNTRPQLPGIDNLTRQGSDQKPSPENKDQ